MQAKRGGHILWMSTFPDLIHCPDAQRLESLMIEFPAIVIPHGIILPDHKIKVELLSNSLVINRRGKDYAGAWLVISCCCAYSTGRVVQHESTATGLDSGGLVRTSWDGDLHRWTAVDVLPLDGMQEVSGSSPLSSTLFRA